MKIASGKFQRVHVPLRAPLYTARGSLSERELIYVELVSESGTRGYGEDAAFSTDWYLPETLDAGERVLPALIEALVGQELAHPRDAFALLQAVPGARECPMACAAVEVAVWDVASREAGMPLAHYLGLGAPGVAVPGGVVLTLSDQPAALRAAGEAVGAGYSRVKVKIAEESDVFTLRALRREFPKLRIMADANGAFSEREFVRIRGELDALSLACIEEPLAREDGEGLADFYARLEHLQMRMATPICLDESWHDAEDMRLALSFEELRCYALKIGKLGGITPSLAFLDQARARGIAVWMGGMFDSAISKSTHAALALHPANAYEPDISDSSRYFASEPCTPPFALADGRISLESPGLGWVPRCFSRGRVAPGAES